MRRLASVRVRLFLSVWILCALHFATNIVREHYPAFALAQHGDLRCDEWADLSPDLFPFARPEGPGTGVHWHANNNVGASLLAAPLLVVFGPLLDRLEATGQRQAAAAASAGAPAKFESDYPMRQKFMAQVRARGLHLRFGAAAAITATLLMAPAAGLLALLLFDLLRGRGMPERRAALLTLVFAFATPLVFRSALLNHNQLQALAAFASFALLWRSHATAPATALRLAAAGALAGTTVLLDYSGLVLLAGLGLYALAVERGKRGARALAGVALPFAAGAALPLALLAFTQWWQFGDPFAPAQRHMPDAHFSVRGWHGFSLPSPDLLWKNLLDPSYGLFAFAPLLLLALLPAPYPAILPRRERRFVLALSAAFVLFCASNQFTRLQWNTGMRATAPLVPFLFLAACDRLSQMKPGRLLLVALPCALHAWVLAMARATPPLAPEGGVGFADSTIARSWRLLFERGVELPWLRVWRQTQPGGGPAWAGFVAPLLVAAAVALLLALGALARPRLRARGGVAA